jgi:hypothetical protein
MAAVTTLPELAAVAAAVLPALAGAGYQKQQQQQQQQQQMGLGQQQSWVWQPHHQLLLRGILLYVRK